MLPLDQLSPQEIDEISVKDAQGRIEMRIGYIATFYLPQPSTRVHRDAIIHCAEEYFGLYKDHLRWCSPTSSRTWLPLESRTLSQLTTHLTSASLDDEVDILFHSGQREDDAPQYFFTAVSASVLRSNILGYVSIGIPLGTHSPQHLCKIVESFASALQPYHGYSGPGFLLSQSFPAARKAERAVYPYLDRFPGLEFDCPSFHSIECVNGIKGINWLTVLSKDLTQTLGGIPKLMASLPHDALIHEYSGGVVLQAGDHPTMGDTEKGSVPASYRAIAQVVKPLRARYRDSIIETPPGVDPAIFTERWLSRFE